MEYETEYAASNPEWHLEDTDDKVAAVLAAIERSGLRPASLCDVGCGAGAVVRELHARLGTERAVGYDVSEYALAIARQHEAPGLEYVQGDAASVDAEHYDLLLLLDVVEHVGDPVAFLAGLRSKADTLIVNVPLELSVLKVVSGESLLRGRKALGHVHYFNEALALAALDEAGYDVLDSRLTPPGTARDVDVVSRRVLRALQRRATAASPSLAARTIGGSSLVITAQPR